MHRLAAATSPGVALAWGGEGCERLSCLPMVTDEREVSPRGEELEAYEEGGRLQIAGWLKAGVRHPGDAPDARGWRNAKSSRRQHRASGTSMLGLGPIPAYRTQACSVIANDENPTSFAPVRNEADLL
jgi:hypothetical protein